jgi:hypothetical protein
MQIFLTAKSKNGDNYVKPRVVIVDPAKISMTPVSKSGGYSQGLCRVEEKSGNSVDVYYVYESPAEINAQILMNEGQATGLLAKKFIDLSIDAAGATAAAAADIVKYFTEIDTATATTTDGYQLPAATVGKVCVVYNTVPGAGGAGIALDAWPQTGENFRGLADDATLQHAVNIRKHYVCLEAGTWDVADDFTQA